MFDSKKISLLLGVTAVVLGATLAIAGSSKDRLRRHVKPRRTHALASANYVQGLRTHRFRVSLQTLRAWLSGPRPPVLVDIRHKAPYQAGHLPNALWRCYDQLLSGTVKLGAGRHQVVIYDQDGRLAPLLIHPLRRRGIDAYMLAGGYAAWLSPHVPSPGAKTLLPASAHTPARPAAGAMTAPAAGAMTPPTAAAPSAAMVAPAAGAMTAPTAAAPPAAMVPPPATAPPPSAPPVDSGDKDETPPGDEGC